MTLQRTRRARKFVELEVAGWVVQQYRPAWWSGRRPGLRRVVGRWSR
jgi:hypothetical protein